MRGSRVAWWIVLAMVGCGGKDTASAGATSAGGSGSTSRGGGGTFQTSGQGTFGGSTGGGATSAATTSAGTSGGTAADGGGFVVPPDGGQANECDPKAQDCPPGQKCTAWANDGGNFWNADRCIQIGGMGVAGDSCTAQGGGVSGVDDCDLGYICLNTDMNNMGQCVQFCQGSNEDCGPGSVCAIYNEGVLPICLVGCDPLLQNCPSSQECIDTPNGTFICFTDASGSAGVDGDPCPPSDGENSCDPGLWCGPGSAGCTDVNCCTPYCDLSDPQCTAPDECVSFFGTGNAPPGFENVGVCVIPS